MPKHMPGMDMMDTTALTRIPAPQQVQRSQTVLPVSLGTGVMDHSCCTKGDEGKDWSRAAATGRAPPRVDQYDLPGTSEANFTML